MWSHPPSQPSIEMPTRTLTGILSLTRVVFSSQAWSWWNNVIHNTTPVTPKMYYTQIPQNRQYSGFCESFRLNQILVSKILIKIDVRNHAMTQLTCMRESLLLSLLLEPSGNRLHWHGRHGRRNQTSSVLEGCHCWHLASHQVSPARQTY